MVESLTDQQRIQIADDLDAIMKKHGITMGLALVPLNKSFVVIPYAHRDEPNSHWIFNLARYISSKKICPDCGDCHADAEMQHQLELALMPVNQPQVRN